MDLWSVGGVALVSAVLALGIGVGYWRWGRQLAEDRQRIGGVEAERLSLSHRLDAAASELTQTRARLVAAQTQYDKLAAELQAKDSSLADLTIDLRKVEAQLAGRETTLGELRTSLASITGAAPRQGDLLTTVGEIRQTLGSRIARVSEVEGELAELREQVEQSGRAADSLRARVTELETELNTTRAAAADSQRASARLRELEESIQARDRRITELETELEDIRTGTPAPAPDVLPVRTTRAGTAPADHADDLKQIYGIGPVLEKTLNELGIRTWEQIAAFTKDDIEHVAAALGTFPDRIVRDDWMAGARKLLPHDEAHP